MKMKPVFMTFSKITGFALLMATFMVFDAYSAQDPNFYIFLAFGQSNMEGYPGVEAQDKTGVSPRFQLLPAVNWSDGSRTKGTWTTAIPPLCRSGGPGLNPCDYFGRTLVDSLPANIKIGIINVAVAGCAIEMFDKDKYKSYVNTAADWLKSTAAQYGGNPGNPYARLVEMGKLAQQDGVIKGILMHQGESGSSTNQWANEVKTIYNNLITDLGLDASKTPFLAGDLVRTSQMVKNLPTTLPNSYVISSTNCEGRSDGLHFTAKGYREIGKRYAVTMLDILRKQGISGVAEGSAVGGAKVGYNLGNIMGFKNGMASVSFEIPQRAFVSLKVYTLGGKEVARLADAEYAGGKHTLEVGRISMPTGMYVIKMKSGSFSAIRTIPVCMN